MIGVDSRDEIELNTLGPFRFDLARYSAAKDAAVRSWWVQNEQLQVKTRRARGARRDNDRCNDSRSKAEPSAGRQAETTEAKTNSHGNG